MNTKLHICYKCVKGPACSLIGGPVPISPHGPRLVDSGSLNPLSCSILSPHTFAKLRAPPDILLYVSASASIHCWMKADAESHTHQVEVGESCGRVGDRSEQVRGVKNTIRKCRVN